MLCTAVGCGWAAVAGVGKDGDDGMHDGGRAASATCGVLSTAVGCG